MQRKLGKFLAGITTLVALIFGTMSALPAHAGTYGQQIEIYNPYSNYAHACIYGSNQYGQSTSQCVDLPYMGVTWDYNWWWEGQVTLVYYGYQWQYLNSQVVGVPTFQWNSDWYTVYV